jgi:phosphoglucomutase
VIGGEESFGLMIGNQIRDKDAISAVALLCEMAAYEKNKGRSLYDKMIDMYLQYGLYKEDLVSITKKGMNGAAEIAAMMKGYRDNPPTTLDGVAVTELLDYEMQSGKNLSTGKSWAIDLPKSNVLQFVLADGSKISARPSGTEPKIKFYFSVKGTLDNAAAFEGAEKALDEKIARIVKEMQLK